MIRTLAKHAALATAAALLTITPAAAQSVDFKPIEAKNLGTKTKIDPAKGYILISSPHRLSGTFIKAPDEAEKAEYQAEWDKQFDKAQKKYASRIKQWEIDRKSGIKAGDKPIEPTRETFTIGEIERKMMVGFGPMYAFEKSPDDAVSYLVEVEPGDYSYYGPVMTMPNGQAFGSCYCMGSVGFAVKAGVITNLGDFLTLGWADEAAIRQMAAVVPEVKRSPVPAAYPVPAALASQTVERADWRAVGKMNNFYGIAVSRMPPVDGVLAYNRDRVIDLKAP